MEISGAGMKRRVVINKKRLQNKNKQCFLPSVVDISGGRKNAQL